MNDAAQANNPLLRAKAFNMHDYYVGNLTDIDEDANQFWLRYAAPFSIGDSKWLMRASLLAINTVPAAPEFEHETGLGDFNVFAAYQMDVGIPGVSFGVGPLLNIPTASEDATGSGKWSAGVANVLFERAVAEVPVRLPADLAGEFRGRRRSRRRQRRRRSSRF